MGYLQAFFIRSRGIYECRFRGAKALKRALAVAGRARRPSRVGRASTGICGRRFHGASFLKRIHSRGCWLRPALAEG